MARNLGAVLRQLSLISNRNKLRWSYHHLHSISSNSIKMALPPPLSTPASIAFPFSNFPFLQHRFLSSSPSASGPSNIVIVKSEEGFKSAFKKVQDGSLPAIFYFTAVWCGPCRLISPVIGRLSEQYPHVTTYKIDIDEEDLAKTLSELNITSVPTFHFFQNGKKAAEVIGADGELLKRTVEKLYQ